MPERAEAEAANSPQYAHRRRRHGRELARAPVRQLLLHRGSRGERERVAHGEGAVVPGEHARRGVVEVEAVRPAPRAAA